MMAATDRREWMCRIDDAVVNTVSVNVAVSPAILPSIRAPTRRLCCGGDEEVGRHKHATPRMTSPTKGRTPRRLRTTTVTHHSIHKRRPRPKVVHGMIMGYLGEIELIQLP